MPLCHYAGFERTTSSRGIQGPRANESLRFLAVSALGFPISYSGGVSVGCINDYAGGHRRGE